MSGDKDLLVPVENAYKFEKDLPNSILKVYENVGHVPMEEIPEQTAEDARSFLSSSSRTKLK